MFARFSTSVWGIAPLCLALACSSDGSGRDPKPFTDPATANNTGGDTNGNASNATNNGDAADEDDAGNGKPTPRPDAGNTSTMDASAPDAMVSADSGIKPDAMVSLDSGIKMDSGTSLDSGLMMDSGADKDAGALRDSGLPLDSGLSIDSGTKLDSGSAVDAGPKPDSGTTSDAGPKPDAGSVDAGPACGTLNLIAGNSCVGVVTCQDENFSGDPILDCALTGAKPNRCCTTAIGASDSCRTTACGNGDNEAKCDGPEDCAGNTTGALCCFNAGAAACAAACTNPNRMCHKDADCAAGSTCEVGSNAQGTQYSWWGFCRGT